MLMVGPLVAMMVIEAGGRLGIKVEKYITELPFLILSRLQIIKACFLMRIAVTSARPTKAEPEDCG